MIKWKKENKKHDKSWNTVNMNYVNKGGSRRDSTANFTTSVINKILYQKPLHLIIEMKLKHLKQQLRTTPNTAAHGYKNLLDFQPSYLPRFELKNTMYVLTLFRFKISAQIVVYCRS